MDDGAGLSFCEGKKISDRICVHVCACMHECSVYYYVYVLLNVQTDSICLQGLVLSTSCRE